MKLHEKATGVFNDYHKHEPKAVILRMEAEQKKRMERRELQRTSSVHQLDLSRSEIHARNQLSIYSRCSLPDELTIFV